MDRKITIKHYRRVQDLKEVQHLIDLRLDVFVGEQGFTKEQYTDDLDLNTTHLEMLCDGKLAGTVRLTEEGDKVYMSRFVLVSEFRSLGLGKYLMNCVISEVPRIHGVKELYLYASTLMMGFYQKCGCKIISGPETWNGYETYMLGIVF